MSRNVLIPFEEYQKSRITFVQNVAELATRPQNIEALNSAGVMLLLRPLLLDSVSSIQQSAALAIGRLANHSEDLAESVIQNDIISQLIASLSNQNRFFKKAACFVLRAVAKHSPQLADDVVKSGALEPLVKCLEEFDTSVKESAAWALGYIAKHNASLAHQVVEARAIESLILCLSESEPSLKRAAAQTLSYICQHTEQLAQPVTENGLETIINSLSFNDVQVKRNICLLLGNIVKHSYDLAEQVMSKLNNNPQKLLLCLKESDKSIKKNAAFCICEIVNKSSKFAQDIVTSGGATFLVEFISNVKGDIRLYGILTLGFIAAFKYDLAKQVLRAKAITQLKDALQNEPHQHIKSAACYALGHIGRHSQDLAAEIANANVLALMLYHYMSPESSDDLKEKSKQALKKIIDACTSLSSLEPLLHVAPEKILKHILSQFTKHLKDNNVELKAFVSNGGLQRLQELKQRVHEPLREKIDEINSYYPDNIVKYYSPEYATQLLNKIENFNQD
jgi:3-methyladenine DNA glycosylase AlkD